MLDAISEHSVEVAYARAGEVIALDDADLEILAPYPDDEFGGVNDYSIVARLTHGVNSFLFTGDMEEAAEVALLERGVDVSAKVLQVAHHGSRTSSTRNFLDAVNGRWAVISVGAPNRYNHPSDDVVQRLEIMDYLIFRTDERGTIVFESTPSKLVVITEKMEVVA
jgi:competence protein ComEC